MMYRKPTLCSIIVVLCTVVSTSAFAASTLKRQIPSSKTEYFGRTQNSLELYLQDEMADRSSRSTDVNETINALRRLLERQHADLEMTKEILVSLEQNNMLEGRDENNCRSLGASLVNGYDYGFSSRSEGGTCSEIKGDLPVYAPPGNIWRLGWGQFWRNWEAMKGEYKDEVDLNLTPSQEIIRGKLESLTLDSSAIWKREEQAGIEAPIVVKIPYLALCWLIDVLFERRYVFSRFFFLETVARMPYFSYISMIHLYETLGFWRRSADAKRIHFAEELNEFRHLLIAESLGGDQEWWVRFMAQHSAIIYYFGLCFLWLLSPSLSYEFSRLLEMHAVNTYGQFLDENEELLKNLPPPLTAIEYYSFGASDPFYAEFQIAAILNDGKIRRPGRSMQSLCDVFHAIKADEADHVSAMEACLDPNVALISPSIERRVLTAAAVITALGFAINRSGGLTFDMDVESLESIGSDGMLEATATGLGALASQITGGLLRTNEGAIEGTEILAESATVEAAVSGLLGGIAAMFGLSKLFTGRTDEKGKSSSSPDNEDDM